jgi:polyhydroxyalkanoate synthesis regulator phasin
MAEPASPRPPLESLGLAGIGALALVVERIDELGEELARRLGVERSEVRGALADVVASWQRETQRLGESTGEAASRVASELGVASRERLQELELRVAQLEHRLKLLERP